MKLSESKKDMTCHFQDHVNLRSQLRVDGEDLQQAQEEEEAGGGAEDPSPADLSRVDVRWGEEYSSSIAHSGCVVSDALQHTRTAISQR